MISKKLGSVIKKSEYGETACLDEHPIRGIGNIILLHLSDCEGNQNPLLILRRIASQDLLFNPTKIFKV